MSAAAVTISVVSHGQIGLVGELLQGLADRCTGTSLDVILTLNIPEEVPEALGRLPYPVQVIRNTIPRGFGENHNQAFRHAKAPFFCVINPDIRIDGNVFPVLTTGLEEPSCGVIAPLIVNAEGALEDSARRFPTPFRILCKLLHVRQGQDYQMGSEWVEPDWVGGMFMVFRRDTYALLGGFDQRFFLYYEDVDLCARIRLKGLRVVLTPSVRATHLARRSSHTDMSYSLMHIRSMVRFFTSLVFLKVMWRRER